MTLVPESNSKDHYFSRFHQGGDRFALLQAHFAHRGRGHNRRNVLPTNGKAHLRYQSADLDVRDPANQLIAPADLAETGAP